MTTTYKPVMIKLNDGSEATKTMIDIVFGCLLELSQTKPDVLTELVKKCRDDDYKLYGSTLDELAQINLVGLNGKSYGYIVPIVLTMTAGQIDNFKPIHPVADSE